MIKNNLFKKLGKSVLDYLPSALIFTIVFSIIAKPLLVGAQAVNPVSKILLHCTQSPEPCGWIDFISLLNAIIHYGIELIGIVFVLVLLYTGFMYLTSGGDAGKVKKARDMITKLMWGLMYTLCGWIIVYFILKNLGVDPLFYGGEGGILSQ
jgi:hypothetical protein